MIVLIMIIDKGGKFGCWFYFDMGVDGIDVVIVNEMGGDEGFVVYICVLRMGFVFWVMRGFSFGI